MSAGAAAAGAVSGGGGVVVIKSRFCLPLRGAQSRSVGRRSTWKLCIIASQRRRRRCVAWLVPNYEDTGSEGRTAGPPYSARANLGVIRDK